MPQTFKKKNKVCHIEVHQAADPQKTRQVKVWPVCAAPHTALYAVFYPVVSMVKRVRYLVVHQVKIAVMRQTFQ